MLGTKEISAVEKRALAARLTMAELCEKAGIPASSWSRAKSRGSIRPKTLKKVEDALTQIEGAA